MSSFQFQTTTGVNSILWVNSLRDSESGWSRRTTDDLDDFCRRKGINFYIQEPKSLKEFQSLFNSIAHYAFNGLRPIIHLSMHGNKKKGLFIEGSKEFVSWSNLANLCRTINIGTHNNLIVVSGACHGFHAIERVEIGKPCPFYMLYAPENEISLGDLEGGTVKFYIDLFDSLDFDKSAVDNFDRKLRIFHAEKLLAEALAGYIRNHCRGKGLKKRREAILTSVLRDSRRNSVLDIKKVRNDLKKYELINQELVDRYERVFLIGKKSGFTLEEILSLSEKI